MEHFSSLDSGLPDSPKSDSAASDHSIDLPRNFSDSPHDSDRDIRGPQSPDRDSGASDQSIDPPLSFTGSQHDSDSDRDISHSPYGVQSPKHDTDDMDDDDTINCDDTLNATAIHNETLTEEVDGIDETDSSKPVGGLAVDEGLCHHQEHPHKVDSVSDSARRPLRDIGCNSSKKRKETSADSGDEKKQAGKKKRSRQETGKADKENAGILKGIVGRHTKST